jgi:p-hydroxybenzoate 3-monooxygenase
LAVIRTQVGIVGAGPAGLMLSHLLAREGIDSVVLEARSRDYVENRVRAGVLEQGTVDLLNATGLGERLKRDGSFHEGVELRFEGRGYRIDFASLTAGRRIALYGQQEIVKDLIAARLAAGGAIHFNADGVTLQNFAGKNPSIEFRAGGKDFRLSCDFIAGCDGSHGISRRSVSAGFTEYERTYPFAWLGILTEAAPAAPELVYAHHERGFALLSTRSPTLQRFYLQVDPGTAIEDWPDSRIRGELQRRTATSDGRFRVPEGPITQRSIAPLRSFVVTPMQSGSLYLAGDAAHIVPPTGAKGMNLAIADVRYLAEGFAAHYRTGDDGLLAAYSDRCLRRVWQAQRFSWWMTTMLHRNPEDSPYDRKRQLAELDYVTSSRAAMTTLAENYVGLPFEDAPRGAELAA